MDILQMNLNKNTMVLLLYLFILLALVELCILPKIKNVPRETRLYSLPVGLGIAALGYYLLTRTRRISEIDYEIGIPGNIKLNGTELSGIIPVTFINPSNQQTGFKDLYLPVYYNDKNIGELIYKGEAKILPSSRTVVNASFKANLINIGTSILTQLLTGNLSLNPFLIKGNINIGGFNLFIKREIQIPLPKI